MSEKLFSAMVENPTTDESDELDSLVTKAFEDAFSTLAGNDMPRPAVDDVAHDPAQFFVLSKMFQSLRDRADLLLNEGITEAGSRLELLERYRVLCTRLDSILTEAVRSDARELALRPLTDHASIAQIGIAADSAVVWIDAINDAPTWVVAQGVVAAGTHAASQQQRVEFRKISEEIRKADAATDPDGGFGTYI